MHSCVDMRAILINLVVLLVALAVYLWMSSRFPSTSEGVVEVQVTQQPLAPSAPTVEPLPELRQAAAVAVPRAEPEPERPVQSVEERGDAMLFEVGALSGMPFDQPVVMPFE